MYLQYRTDDTSEMFMCGWSRVLDEHSDTSRIAGVVRLLKAESEYIDMSRTVDSSRDSRILIRTVETHGKGALSFFEGLHDIPFEIKRIYYIHSVPAGVDRGGHAHRKLSQLLICVHGSIAITLDDGLSRHVVLLDDPSNGLIVNDLTWREMHWIQEGSVLMVAASAYYDESDYIRDYGTFLEEVSKKHKECA